MKMFLSAPEAPPLAAPRPFTVMVQGQGSELSGTTVISWVVPCRRME